MKQIIITSVDSQRLQSRIKESQTRSESILKLNEEIERAKIVEPKKVPKDVITMHSRVKIHNMDINKSMEVQLVYPEEADMKQQKVSVFAPIGTALLGFRKGDVIEWEVPKGKTMIKIEDIVYQPEAEGDFNL
ncbi:MAG TPA: nucleoside diphosphate kinase regulator [Bacteroidales bacterium]|nr:nucleoside diphosphate kinase regulator [Bacteroidales bacterium]